MPFRTEIDLDRKIIRNTYTGMISREDLGTVWRHLLTLKEFTELKFNLLSDYRASKFNIARSEGDRLLQFLISVKPILNGKKEAAIISDPKDTALSLLLQLETFEKVGYIVSIFSTEGAALQWLCDPLSR
ncbi:MAG: hypothetical protein JW801_10610 [Bacteroidales bacterium]|nr:hypothetical protein [Bacteroidales bacterium]